MGKWNQRPEHQKETHPHRWKSDKGLKGQLPLEESHLYGHCLGLAEPTCAGTVNGRGKSNEITAIPALLDLLDIAGSIISIDAMGTQTDMAEKIVESKADYILAVKENPKELLEQIAGWFNKQKSGSTKEIDEKGHGRIEYLRCDVITDLTFIDNAGLWTGLKSIVRITSKRDDGKKQTTRVRYYISSLSENATAFNSYIREHWGIENRLHRVLDMGFDEDRQRKRDKIAANNFSLIRKIAFNLLKEDSSKGSIAKRLKAGSDDKFLFKLISQI